MAKFPLPSYEKGDHVVSEIEQLGETMIYDYRMYTLKQGATADYMAGVK